MNSSVPFCRLRCNEWSHAPPAGVITSLETGDAIAPNLRMIVPILAWLAGSGSRRPGRVSMKAGVASSSLI